MLRVISVIILVLAWPEVIFLGQCAFHKCMDISPETVKCVFGGLQAGDRRSEIFGCRLAANAG